MRLAWSPRTSVAGGVEGSPAWPAVKTSMIAALLDAEDAGTPDDLTALRAVVADLAAGVRTGVRA